MITDALRASVSSVSARQASAFSNQATSLGMIGRLLSGMRTTQGCRRAPDRSAQAQRDSPARQPSSGTGVPGASSQAASTIKVSSSSLDDTCRYRDMGAVPASAATRLIDTASSPSVSASRTAAAKIRLRLRDGLGPLCGRSRTPQAAATLPGSPATLPGNPPTLPGNPATPPGNPATLPGNPATLPGNPATLPGNPAPPGCDSESAMSALAPPSG